MDIISPGEFLAFPGLANRACKTPGKGYLSGKVPTRPSPAGTSGSPGRKGKSRHNDTPLQERGAPGYTIDNPVICSG
ncbi:MAG TPA: hypothetical protein PKN44_16120 [Bacteroidales bacterium]|nr:hypothetical protein [Bacteroidales bacterium]